MQMVWHYDKVVEPEFPGRYVGAKHVDHQRGIPFRLQQGAPLAGLGGGEERTGRTQGVVRKSITSGSRHHQGLKPSTSRMGSARLKPCPDTNQMIQAQYLSHGSARLKPCPDTNQMIQAQYLSHGSARLKPCPDTNQMITSCSRKCRNSRDRPPGRSVYSPSWATPTSALRRRAGSMGLVR